MRGRVMILAAAAASALVGTAASSQAQSFSLNAAFQPGDIALYAGGTPKTFAQVRPSNPTASNVITQFAGPTNFYGAFDANGDYDYVDGTLGTAGSYNLYQIPAGQTTSTTLLANLSDDDITNLQVGPNGTIYCGSTKGGLTIDAYTPGGGGYTAGVLATGTFTTATGGQLQIVANGNYLLGTSQNSGANAIVFSVNTSTGAIQTLLGGAASGATTGAFVGPQALVDLGPSPRNDGTDTVLVGGTGKLGTDTAPRVTEIAFNPSTGAVTDPWAAGGPLADQGNEAAYGDPEGEAWLEQSQPQSFNSLALDNAGDLVAAPRYSKLYVIPLADLGPSLTNNTYSGGNDAGFALTTTPLAGFSNPSSSYGIQAVEVDPEVAVAPEPATIGLIGAVGMLLMCRRTRRLV